jgi:hypothetical protein
VFWELVGMCSYLLIGFWYNRKPAADACQKAFVTNRVGDFGLLLGMLAIFWATGSFEFDMMGDRLTELVTVAPSVRRLGGRVRHPGVPRSHGQVSPVPPACVATRRHGRPHPHLGADSRRHDGGRWGLPGGPHVSPCLRSFPWS